MRFASLGSGSQGNALLVEAKETRLLLDCGFSTRATIERLARLSVAPETITAVLVTHEHTDHIAGVFKFARRFAIPVYLTHGTYFAARNGHSALPECHLIDSHAPFTVAGLTIQPFPVPHDAREPVQFVFSDGVRHLGVLTDTGSVTAHITRMLQLCDALVLECNHDADLLAASDYPATLKRRVAGKFGHLDNTQAAFLLQQLDKNRLQHVIAAHLSAQNNRPERVLAALMPVLDCTADWIGVACQTQGFAWREIV